MENMGRKIAGLRKSNNMTQDELAERLGVTPQAVSKWENGVSMPDIAILPKLSEIFSVTIDELFAKDSEPEVRYVPKEKRKSIDEMVLRILIEDGNDHVKINFPIPLLKAFLEMGVAASNVHVGNADLSKIDFDKLFKLIESGVVGRIMEVQSDGQTNIIIEVE